LNGGKSKSIMFIFTESSHDIVGSSRYIPRYRSHMHTTEIDFNSSAIMTKKTTTDNTKMRTADAQAKRSWVNRFWVSGRPII